MAAFVTPWLMSEGASVSKGMVSREERYAEGEPAETGTAAVANKASSRWQASVMHARREGDRPVLSLIWQE